MDIPQHLMIQLYTTSACHLCELAADILRNTNIQVQAIEIADDDVFLARYGTRIPVLKRTDTQAELNWPFTIQDILSFMQ